MQRNIGIIWGALIFIVAVSIGILFLQTPTTWLPDNLEFHQQLTLNSIIAITHTTGAVLFLANMDVYKQKLRRAYAILAFGAVLAGVGTLQISLLTLLNLWETPYGQGGAFMLPFLLSGATLYVAVRSFARLVGAKSILLNAWVAFFGAFLLAFLSSFLPHVSNPAMTELDYDLLVGVSIWSGSLMLFAGYIAYKVQQNTGQHYTHAIRWLKRALIVSGAVLYYISFYSLIYAEFDYWLILFNNFTAVASGFVWVRAGYAFALTKYYDKDVSMLKMLVIRQAAEQSSVNSVIDMVTSTAGLVSNTNEIDPLLDKVRIITVKLKPGETPLRKDTDELIDVYLEIEYHLTTKEAIRTFTIQELRARLSPSLKQLLNNHSQPTHVN